MDTFNVYTIESLLEQANNHMLDAQHNRRNNNERMELRCLANAESILRCILKYHHGTPQHWAHIRAQATIAEIERILGVE